MLSVSVSDVDHSNYPDSPQIISVESEVIEDQEHEYTVQVKMVIDGPDGRGAALSRFYASPDGDDVEEVLIDERIFCYEDGLEESDFREVHSVYVQNEDVKNEQKFHEQCLEIHPSDPVAWYDTVKSEFGWWEKSNQGSEEDSTE